MMTASLIAINSGVMAEGKDELSALKISDPPKTAASVFPPPARETVPPLSAELNKSIASHPVAEAWLAKNAVGGTELVVNGRRNPFLAAFLLANYDYNTAYLEPWVKSGINIIMAEANLGFFRKEFGYTWEMTNQNPFWVGKDKYDFSDVEKGLWRYLRMQPDGNIIVVLSVGTYLEWAQENPDDLVMNEKGQYAIGDHYFKRFDAAPPVYTNKEQRVWSFFSEKFRDDVSKVYTAYIQHIEKTIPGRRIIGYMISGGVDGQFYSWLAPDGELYKNKDLWNDYSPAARKAWKKWVAAKYTNIESVNVAWGKNYTSVADIVPPPAENLMGGNVFHDPQSEQQAIDWKIFLADSRCRLISHLAGVIKEASGKKVIVGAWGGESGVRRDNTSVARIIKDKNIDFLLSQPRYNTRTPPNVGGINGILASHQLNGKYFIADMDHSTYLRPLSSGANTQGLGINIKEDFHGVTSDIAGLRAMFRREFGLLWANGTSGSFDRITSPPYAYMDPPIIGELAFLRTTEMKLSPASPQSPAADIAVIYDENAVHYLKAGLVPLHFDWTIRQETEYNKSGAPWRWYYADDLRDGLIPPAKVYIFQNLVNIDSKTAAEIEKLKKGNALLVFLGATAYVQGGAARDFARKVTGINLLPVNDCVGGQQPAVDHALVAWRKEGSSDVKAVATYEKLARDGSVFWGAENDPGAVLLANYENSSIPAYILKEHKDWSSIFIGTQMLSCRMISALAEFAGAWRLVEPGKAVCAGRDDFIMIHPLKSGLFDVTLKKPGRLVGFPPFTNISETALSHKLSLEAGNTYLFSVESGK